MRAPAPDARAVQLTHRATSAWRGEPVVEHPAEQG